MRRPVGVKNSFRSVLTLHERAATSFASNIEEHPMRNPVLAVTVEKSRLRSSTLPILLDIRRGPGVIGVVPMGRAHINLRAGTHGGLNYSEFVLLALG